jgi:hypothetical protein
LRVPAALSHKEPDPGDFRCISRITDPGSHAERKYYYYYYYYYYY